MGVKKTVYLVICEKEGFKLLEFSKGVLREIEESQVKEGSPAIGVVTRDMIELEEVMVPRVVLENTEEAALFYTKKVWGGREDLRVRMIAGERGKDTKIKVFLVGLREEVVKELLEFSEKAKLKLLCITLAEIFFSFPLEKDSVLFLPMKGGCSVVIKGNEGWEGIYYLPSCKESFLRVIQNQHKEKDFYYLNILNGSSEIKSAKKLERIDLSRAFRVFLKVKPQDTSLLNFLNHDELRKEKRISPVIFTFSLLVLSFLSLFLVVSPILKEKKEVRNLRIEVSRLKKEYERVEALKKKIEEDKTLLESIEKNIPKIPKLDLVLELSKILPKGTKILRLSIRRGDLYISGYTPKALELLERIEKSPYFEGARFTSSIAKGKGEFEGLDRFVLRAKVVE